MDMGRAEGHDHPVADGGIQHLLQRPVSPARSLNQLVQEDVAQCGGAS